MSEVITENLIRVAQKLQELDIDDVVFVGGATIGLFLTDPAAPDPRATLDIDVVTPVSSRAAYHRLEDKLREAGFTQPLGAPICRWLIGEDEVDIMPSDVEILGFSNRWYPALLFMTLSMTPSGSTSPVPRPWQRHRTTDLQAGPSSADLVQATKHAEYRLLRKQLTLPFRTFRQDPLGRRGQSPGHTSC